MYTVHQQMMQQQVNQHRIQQIQQQQQHQTRQQLMAQQQQQQQQAYGAMSGLPLNMHMAQMNPNQAAQYARLQGRVPVSVSITASSGAFPSLLTSSLAQRDESSTGKIPITSVLLGLVDP
jgi:hypothetical protein